MDVSAVDEFRCDVDVIVLKSVRLCLKFGKAAVPIKINQLHTSRPVFGGAENCELEVVEL